MSYVDVVAVEVSEPRARLTDELKFSITFQCKIKPEQADLAWRIVWVGSAKNEVHDQILEEVDVPPELGLNSFDFICDGPNPDKIPADEVLGVTVVMVQALYKGKEFLRVGYYVKVDYTDEKLREEPPQVERPDPALLERLILTDEPRVTRYLIEWDSCNAAYSEEGNSGEQTNDSETVLEEVKPEAQVITS
ncbi:hypothetical protein GUITHDRAFT_83935 [Guillardia theta CCMP2712]|uniref:Anti-silencing function protein 1 n=1 Tax=Guillardia theta (strain CCMP2712) TaxID=905079 RepID=L1K3W8_GUITC|nr:hypothetical protein GUITHDRAFT_83935 [Guillardia theta CCMP2712]EKX55068.1 hypothetical protein GUITHDRAFT_83935 [Guillardia theta CCMP2712]|eukprot:XP_005842048.1 hypothetical protein GUITHDRAFT_83935 [Guillardia theta CCMP2712]